MKKFFSKIAYAILPFLIFLLVLGVSYLGNQILTSAAKPGDFHYGTPWAHTPLDDKIPLVAEFIYVYYLTFPVGIITFFYMAYKNKTKLFDIFITLCLSFATQQIQQTVSHLNTVSWQLQSSLLVWTEKKWNFGIVSLAA